MTLAELARLIVSRADNSQGRFLAALAGPPASGKSTVAEELRDAVLALGKRCEVVPMDGFHLDNPILVARGLLPRKGAPETFDAAGFAAMINRLKQGDEVIIPTFDRSRDIAIAGARAIPAECKILIAEGNYLLFDDPAWRPLASLWSLSIFLNVAEPVLEARLIQRWLDHGLTPDAARARAEGNDLPNARRILAARLSADVDL